MSDREVAWDKSSGHPIPKWAERQIPDGPKGMGNDGLTAEERAAGLAPMFEPPLIVDSGAPCSCERLDSRCMQHNPVG